MILLFKVTEIIAQLFGTCNDSVALNQWFYSNEFWEQICMFYYSNIVVVSKLFCVVFGL